MILEILKYPDPRLYEKSEPVTEFTPQLHKLLDDMVETMYSANGVGLAAAQVGELLRLFVVDIGAAEEEHRRVYEFINPVLSDGAGSIKFEEGCLSVPGVSEEVSRKKQVRIDYQDRFGKPQTMHAEGLLAVAIQHENDHLEGVLFVDRLSPLKRRFVKKKLSQVVTL
jgi:peptide deformylase